MPSNGLISPKKLERVIDRIRFGIRELLLRKVEIVSHCLSLQFICESRLEVFRVKTIFNKEPGTIDWLKKEIQDGDVFYDIGANIGLYAIFAGKIGKGNTKVVAFEPHARNFVSLTRNIVANGLTEVVTPSSIALSDRTEVLPFRIAPGETGVSGSQLVINSELKRTELHEIKLGTPIDAMIDSNWLPIPTLIKIDVDGLELQILAGMKKLLAHKKKPRAIQIEINPGERIKIHDFMIEHGYRDDIVHFSAGGQRKLDRGRTIDQIAYNVIFRPEDP